MPSFDSLPMDALWRYALAAIPIAAIVAVVTRWVPCRPSTRHALWLTVLLWLVVAPMLPTVPALTADRAGILASDNNLGADRNRAPIFVHKSPPMASRRSVARPRPYGGSVSPTRLAQASDVDGPLTFSSDFDSSDTQDEYTEFIPSVNLEAADDAPMPLPLHTDAVSMASPPDPAGPANTGRGDWRAWVIGMFAVRDAFGELPPLPTTLWLGGAALLALLIVARTWFFMRLLGSARPAPADVQRLVAKSGKKIGLRRLPETFMVDNRLSPMILAGRRLRLILPQSLWNELDNDCRRAVVLHELAHVRRRDHWVAWADAIVGTLYWWYPLVWFVRGRVRAEAEHCCDAWVTSLIPSGRRAYAEALLKTKQYIREEKQWVPTTGIGMARGRAERFARRLTMVMTKTAKPGISAPGVALVLMIATASWVATPAQSCPPRADDARPPKLVESSAPAVPSIAAVVPMASVVSMPAVATVPAAVTAAAPTVSNPTVVAAPSVVGIGSGDSLYKCKKCRSEGIACAKCRLRGTVGVGSSCCKTNKAKEAKCKSCSKHGRPCVLCVKSGKDAAFFGQHGIARFPKLAFAPPTFTPPALYFAGMGDQGEPDEKLQRRLEKLERQLERLGRQLEKLGHQAGPEPRRTRGRARPHGPREFVAPEPPPPPHAVHRERHRAREYRVWPERENRRTRERSIERKERRLHTKGKARANRMERKKRKMRRAPRVRSESSSFDGELVVKTYKVSEGKREALHALMIRSDVPVRVRPTNDGIEVHGTPKQQRAFKAFLNIISPTSDGRSDAEDSFRERSFEHSRKARAEVEAVEAAYAQAFQQQAMSDAQRATMAEQAAVQYAEASEQMKSTQAMKMRLAEEAAVRGAESKQKMQALVQAAKQRVQDQMEQMAQAQKAEKLHQLEGQLAALEAERDALEGKLDALRDHADSLRDASDEMRSEADDMQREAKQLRDEAASAEDASDGAAISAEAAAMMAQGKLLAIKAKRLATEAKGLDAQAREVEAKYRAFDEQVEAAERKRDAADD